MQFYHGDHAHFCGVDLHAKTMYLCVLDSEGKIQLHRELPADPDPFLRAIVPFEDLVVAAECVNMWYWLADVCADEDVPFVLGHALYMRAIHGGKVKNDRVDALKIATLLRGGLLPVAYVYPREMRATRDLLRRRSRLVRQRGALLAHATNTNTQYNLEPLPGRLTYKKNRDAFAENFDDDPSLRVNVELDLALVQHYDAVIADAERHILRTVKADDPDAFGRLRSVPGIGKITALTILYEMHTIKRFPRVQHFLSYCRLVRPHKQSAGKIVGHGPVKIGNPHLRWAFGEAAAHFVRDADQRGQRLVAKLKQRHGQAKATSILAQKLGRAVYFMLKRSCAFDMKRFVTR
jgi:transposase